MECQNSQTVSRTMSGDDDKSVVWVDIPTDGSDNRSLSMKELHRLSRYIASIYSICRWTTCYYWGLYV